MPWRTSFSVLSTSRAGKLDEAIRAIETYSQLTGRSPFASGILGLVYALAGRIGEARKLLEELQELAQKAYVPWLAFAAIYSGLGEIDKGFDW